jgi:predicted MFS family arabinose efflux permease
MRYTWSGVQHRYIMGSQYFSHNALNPGPDWFFLVAIYPVGMKIAADYFEKGLGKSLGFLVGALVLGTAFPHFLKGETLVLPWKSVTLTTSSLATVGGLMMLTLVPNGPYRKQGHSIELSTFFSIFKNQNLGMPLLAILVTCGSYMLFGHLRR